MIIESKAEQAAPAVVINDYLFIYRSHIVNSEEGVNQGRSRYNLNCLSFL